MAFVFLSPEDFFERLYEDVDFCDQLGKAVLAAGILESELRNYLKARGISGVSEKLTLGQAVGLLKDNDLLTLNGKLRLEDVVRKRNYLTHNLYALFSSEIEETLLPRNELTAMDVDIFWDKA
jgi:hypothetical protein